MVFTPLQLKQHIYQPVFDVYDIFKNHFGEDYTDLQGILNDDEYNSLIEDYYPQSDSSQEITEETLTGLKGNIPNPHILVWWPKVTVTNEYDKHINITDLYAKIEITTDGNIPFEWTSGFKLIRTSAPPSQIIAGYVHSHVYSDRNYTNIQEFKTPCLGRGPIRQTVLSLMTSYSMELWMLFCEELSRYVTVESLSGGPYIRMESVGGKSEIDIKQQFGFNLDYVLILGDLYSPHGIQKLNDIIKSFFKYYYILDNRLSIDFDGLQYRLGKDIIHGLIDVSNSFIRWANILPTEERQWIKNTNLLNKYVCTEGKIYETSGSLTSNLTHLHHCRCLKFKEEDIYFKILDEDMVEDNAVTLLDIPLAAKLIKNIFNILNYRYNGTNNTESSSNRKTVCYIQNECTSEG